MVCCVVLSPIVLCYVWCGVFVVCCGVLLLLLLLILRAGGVLFKTRTQYQRVLGITLAEVPTTVLG